MQKLFLLSSLFFTSLQGFNQSLNETYFLNFDDSVSMNHLTIDSTLNPINDWKVGPPQKNLFTSALSVPNAIVTDLTNSYSSNDTSVFILTNVITDAHVHEIVELGGDFRVNSDSLLDWGMIEISFDHGITWIDLINDLSYSNVIGWESSPPVLTGNSDGWQYFKVELASLYWMFNVQHGDTVLYRFTFISDGIQTNKDGLMFDDIFCTNFTTLGVSNSTGEFLSGVFPNPVQEHFAIHFDNKNNDDISLSIFDGTGKSNLINYSFSGNEILLDVGYFSPGLYFFKLINQQSGFSSFGKFLKK